MVHLSSRVEGGSDDATPFTFRYNNVRDFAASLHQSPLSVEDADRAATHRQLCKWGFSANTMQLHSIRYEYEQQEHEDYNVATADFSNEAQFLYYKGWSKSDLNQKRKARMDGLLTSIFADKELLSALALPSRANNIALHEIEEFLGESGGTLKDVVVHYSTLNATVTSLEFFDELMRCPEAVRTSKSTSTNGGNSVRDVLVQCGEEDPNDGEVQAVSSRVISNATSHKITDVFLPSGVTVSDLVRAFFLIPTTDAAMAGVMSRCVLHNNVQIWEEIQESANQYSGQPDWGDEEDDPCSNPQKWFNRLLLEGRGELLFHVFWRLVVGGGSMCQWSDQLAAYKVIARELYRDLVCVAKRPSAIGQMQKAQSGEPSVAHTPSDDVDDGPSENDKQQAGDMNSFYDLVVQTEAVAIHRVSYVFQVGDESRTFVLPLFPTSSSRSNVVPSNVGVATVEERMDSNNYCYLTLNPTRQETVIWYHSLSQ